MTDTAAFQTLLNSGAKDIAISSNLLLAKVTVPPDVRLHDAGGEISFVTGSTPRGLVMGARSALERVRFNVNGADTVGTSAIVDVAGQGVTIRGCTFDGKVAGPGAFKANYTVRLSDTIDCSDALIDGNRFLNTYYGIIRQEGSPGIAHRLRIIGNSFAGICKGDAVQINLGSDRGLVIANNVVDGVTDDGLPNRGIGICVAGTWLNWGGTEATEPADFVITGNVVRNAIRGIHAEACHDFLIADNLVSGISGPTEAGIQVYASHDFAIRSNHIHDCARALVGANGWEGNQQDRCRNFTIRGNTGYGAPALMDVELPTPDTSDIGDNHWRLAA